MNKCKISIIIPCFNAGKYIENCINSILNSGRRYWDTFEIIIINDGSTDNTEEVLRHYHLLSADGYGVKIINTHNQGVSHARNIGIKRARGEYIWFIDADVQS